MRPMRALLGIVAALVAVAAVGFGMLTALPGLAIAFTGAAGAAGARLRAQT
ncbi:MAG: hypothetical protein ACK4MD_04395 [Demequina sp.]